MGLGKLRGASAAVQPPVSFMPDRDAHEIIEQHEAAKGEADLDDAADRGIELQQAAERPACRPGGADHLGADENGDRDKRRDMQPVDWLLLRQWIVLNGVLGQLLGTDRV